MKMGEMQFAEKDWKYDMLRYRVILFVLLLMAVLSGCGNVAQEAPHPTASSSSPTTPSSVSRTPTSSSSATSTMSTPKPTTTGVVATPSPLPATAETMAISYYQALEAQTYSIAYTHLDANAIDITTGQKLTLQLFTQLAQDSDNTKGSISNFSAAAYPPLVVMTVTRSGGPYHVHLQVKQENGIWKITSLDRI